VNCLIKHREIFDKRLHEALSRWALIGAKPVGSMLRGQTMDTDHNALELADKALSDAERRVAWMTNVISLLRKHRQETTVAEDRLARFMRMRDAFRAHRQDVESRASNGEK
jgi:hypothetical protein